MKTKLNRNQRNRLLGKETERDPNAEYTCEIGIRPFNGNEYYKNIYDSEGVYVGTNLSVRSGRKKKDDDTRRLGGN